MLLMIIKITNNEDHYILNKETKSWDAIPE